MPAAPGFDAVPAAGALRDALLGDPTRLTAPVSSLRDKYELLPAFLAVRGLVKQHIDSFNYLVEHDVRRVATPHAACSHPKRRLSGCAPAARRAQMRKIVQAKANEKVTCDADPSFYLKCAPWRQARARALRCLTAASRGHHAGTRTSTWARPAWRRTLARGS